MPSSPSAARGSNRRAAGDERTLGVLAALVLTVLSTGIVSSTLLTPAAAAPAGLAPPAAATDAGVGPAVFVLPELVPPPVPVPPPPPPEPEPEPEPVQAAVDPLCGGGGWQQRRGEAALATLRRPSDAAAFRISYEPGRSGVIGLAVLHERRMRVFVRDCDALSTSLLTHVVAHELGHLVDVDRMDADLRRQWIATRGIPAGTPWYGCDGCTDFATPAGDFAEVYAQWQRGADGNLSEMAPAPSAAELADLAARFF